MTFNAQGHRIASLAGNERRLNWSADARGKDIAESAQLFSPPALGKKNLYLASGAGHLLSLDQKNGNVQFIYATGQPITFQPALARGNVYVGTANGILLCIKTGSDDADGWSGWGGNAQHNKKD